MLIEKLPLIQKVFWSAWELNRNSAAYHLPFEFQIDSNLDMSALVKALRHYVYNINPLCRAKFFRDGSDVFYAEDQNHIFNLRIEEGLLDRANYSELRDNFAFMPFDLEKGEVYRFLISKNKNSYTLLVVFHHLILDTITYTNFLKSISDFYNYELTGLPELHSVKANIKQFKDLEQKAFEKIDYTAIHENFVADSLYVNLFSGNQKSIESYPLTGRSFSFETSKEMFLRIKEFIRQPENVSTFFRLVTATCAILLKFYSGQKTIVINYPVNLRPKSMNELGGSYVNVLPLSIDFNENPSFTDILKQINQQIKRSRAYEWLPYQNTLAHLREQNRITPDDFANISVAESLGLIRKEIPCFNSVESKPIALENFEPIFDINFCCAVTSNLLLQVDYNSAKFSEDFIKTFAEHFIQLLDYVLEHPKETVNLAMIYNKNDWEKVISPKIYKQDQSDNLVEVFSKKAKECGQHIALTFLGESYSYGNLDAVTNQWAAYIRATYKKLHSYEMPPDTLIGLSVERSADMVIGLISILKAGAAYVPIDPKYPEDRINNILTDSNLAFILTSKQHEHLFNVLPDTNKIFINDEMVLKEVRALSGTPLDIKIMPENLAYIIYTSGSTGKPKGVMITHENVCRLFKVTEQYFNFNAQDQWSLFHSVSFDFSVWEIWGALLYGGTLHVAPYEISRDPRAFYQWVQSHNISILNQTPSAFQKFIEEDANHETKLNNLRYVIFGGEALRIKPLRIWAKKYGLEQPKLINMYGITETTVHVTYKQLTQADLAEEKCNIGMPLSDLAVFLVDENMQLCPPGIPGEMYVAGKGVARGYLNRDELTKQRFISNPFAKDLNLPDTTKLYRSGDLARRAADGSLEYLGRIDSQVKIRGFRIELGEIEAIMLNHPSIKQAVVIINPQQPDTLITYYSLDKISSLAEFAIRQYLSVHLPDYMIPAQIIEVSNFPVNHNGKIDLHRLPEFIVQKKAQVLQKNKFHISKNSLPSMKEEIKAIWSEILKKNDFDECESFFNLGGDSFSLLQMREQIERKFKQQINAVDLFQYNTLDKLTDHLSKLLSPEKLTTNNAAPALKSKEKEVSAIAIVGMACRIPGADTPEAFWQMLIEGGSSIRDFSINELKENYISEAQINSPTYVKRGSILEDAYCFDAGFFGYSVKEAEIMDPQQRQFLECAWEALEHSGNVPEKFIGDIGVFASQGENYYLKNIQMYQPNLYQDNHYQVMLGNEKDFLSTKVSFKLNLTGPSMNLQTGCSSSLVSIFMACQSLKNKNCDMALAGGVSLFYKYGYPYQEGMIESPDGYCRAFDADAKGTVAGSGLGVVVLKRLDDAIADKDTIYAVIRGGAINNDGAAKMGYTAPSIDGQTSVIEKALKNANVSAQNISYVEAHGTGTPLGDPIEWAALHRAYEKSLGVSNPSCLIGSLKTNIGHTDAAAGVLGLIKMAMALKYRIIPASLNFKTLNPEIKAFNKLFQVVSETMSWSQEQDLRRAAISSFGIGGTNTHLILEEYSSEIDKQKEESKSHHSKYLLIPISAKTEKSLHTQMTRMRDFIGNTTEYKLSDVAFTMQQGRAEFKERGFFIIDTENAQNEKVKASYINEASNQKNLKVILKICPTHTLQDDVIQKINEVLDTEINIVQVQEADHALKIDMRNNTIFIDLQNIITSENSNLALFETFGQLWTYGVKINWEKLNAYGEDVHKVALPRYVFEKQTHTLDFTPALMLQEKEAAMIEINNSAEFTLKMIWSEVLGVKAEEINVLSDFIGLGGDSFTSIDLLARIKKSFAINLDMEKIAENYSFSSMLGLINSHIS